MEPANAIALEDMDELVSVSVAAEMTGFSASFICYKCVRGAFPPPDGAVKTSGRHASRAWKRSTVLAYIQERQASQQAAIAAASEDNGMLTSGDICDLLQTTRQNISYMRKHGKFPEPDGTAYIANNGNAYPAWKRSTVEAYARDAGIRIQKPMPTQVREFITGKFALRPQRIRQKAAMLRARLRPPARKVVHLRGDEE